MRHILLTWNPGLVDTEQWSPSEWQRDMVDRTANGRTIRKLRWSVGNRVNGIEPGDRAYMYRQGSHGRGLVACGTIRSTPYLDEHWDGGGGQTRYVKLEWQECLPLAGRLGVAELVAGVPSFPWTQVYGSGREVKGVAAQQLSQLWADHFAADAQLPLVVQGAGFGDAEKNRRVEAVAMKLARDMYEARGFTVDDVSLRKCGQDLTATNENCQIHVEVKGVSGLLPTFFLTSNELDKARTDPDWVLLVVTNALNRPQLRLVEAATVVRNAAARLYQVRVPDTAPAAPHTAPARSRKGPRRATP